MFSLLIRYVLEHDNKKGLIIETFPPSTPLSYQKAKFESPKSVLSTQLFSVINNAPVKCISLTMH